MEPSETLDNPIHESQIEVVLEKLDKSFKGAGAKPSEVWRYREEVRAKYNLPESGTRWTDPVRYIQVMEDLLRKEGIKIREKHEFENFFKENPGADALSSGPNAFRDNTVVVGSNRPDGEYWRLRAKANQLAHEAVHALQSKRYPRMPDEEAEREAYLYQKLYPENILEHQEEPEDIVLMLDVIEQDIKNSIKINEQINGKTETTEAKNSLIYADIYREAIDKNIFTRRADDSMFPFEADPKKVKALIDPYLKELEEINASQKEDIGSVEFPPDLDLEKEVKNGTQRVISLLVHSGLADIRAVRGAARYVGPRNTHYKPEDMDYHFAPTMEYIDYLNANNYEWGNSKHVPPPPHSRSEFFKLEVGGVGLKSNTGENLRIAKELGLPMDITQAMRLELVRACGHEYGHAILRGVDHAGKNTFQEAVSKRFIESPELLDFTAETTHDEHFARGMEVALEKRYMAEIGYTEEQIESFLGVKSKNWEQDKNIAYSFLKYVTSLGYTPREVIKLQNALMAGASRAYEGQDVNFYLWHVTDIIAYRIAPYSEEQLTTLMSGN